MSSRVCDGSATAARREPRSRSLAEMLCGVVRRRPELGGADAVALLQRIIAALAGVKVGDRSSIGLSSIAGNRPVKRARTV